LTDDNIMGMPQVRKNLYDIHQAHSSDMP